MSSAPRNGSTAHRANRVDTPLKLRHIPITFDNARLEQSAQELVEEFDPRWKTDAGQLEFVRFTEGITNTLTKAVKRWPGKTESEIDEEAILIRAYGKGTDLLIDRERELKSHTLLASLGLAPALLARFDNGFMYRFIAGHPCTPEDLRRPEVYRQVAKRLGEWHGALPITAITDATILDGSPEPPGLQNESSGRPEPNPWTVMRKWIHALPSGNEEERKRNKVLGTELAALSQRFGDTPGLAGKDYVFGHCDLLSGNVIVTHPSNVTVGREELPVSFIDYEYATPSPAAFDIANHFAEFAGFECDHGAVPTKSQRRDFLHHYVKSFHDHVTIEADEVKPEVDLEKDVDVLYEQVEQFRGIPGFYWGIWSLIQATISLIDFDYASYAELRLGEYWAWKAEEDGSRAREGNKLSLRERRWAEE